MFDNQAEAFARFKKRFFKDSTGDFEQGGEVNSATQKRNTTITIIVLGALAIIALFVWRITQPGEQQDVQEQDVGFGAVITDDFTERDNQSALTFQQDEIIDLKGTVSKLEGTLDRFEQSLASELKSIKDTAKREQESQMAVLEQEMQTKLAEANKIIERLESQLSEEAVAHQTSNRTHESSNGKTFGEYTLPPRPSIGNAQDNPNIAEFQYQQQDDIAFNGGAFDSFEFNWQASIEEKQAKRTIDNYVPTGTFVTAVVTGGADANAGVSGQGDTAPVVFQTVNNGVLPNGKKSKLNNCTITGAAYGEISSSRGIVRTNRLSCIQENGDILDIPVNATVFNFGRNGIRGTTILKNGKIVQMAGIAGILQGVGDAGKALATTTTPTALGPSQTIDSNKVGLNLLGSASESVGSKLADYYIKLAELYHPIVEINPGAIVNIVFLEGFPLDPLLADEYESRIEDERKQASSSNHILDVISNAPNSLPASAPINPLAQQLTQQGLSSTGFGREE